MDQHKDKFEALYVAKEIQLDKAAEKFLVSKPEIKNVKPQIQPAVALAPVFEGERKLIDKRREFLVYQIDKERQYLFVFGFGSLVFFNIEDVVKDQLKKELSKFYVNPVRKTIDESYELVEHGSEYSVYSSESIVPKVTFFEIEVVARILAQSVAMENFENIVDELLDNAEKVNKELEKAGKLRIKSKEIIKFIATDQSIVQYIISKLSLLDNPEITWEKEELGVFYSRLSDMFELRPRFRNLQFKIDFVKDNFEFLLDLLRHHSETRLELIVIWLFVVELVLFLIEIFQNRIGLK